MAQTLVGQSATGDSIARMACLPISITVVRRPESGVVVRPLSWLLFSVLEVSGRWLQFHISEWS